MTATYVAGATDKDKVRLMIGDRDCTTGVVLFQDEEINDILDDQPDVKLASVDCIDAAIAEYAHRPSTAVGNLSLGPERVAQLAKLRALIMGKVARKAGISVGGRTLDAEQVQAEDETLRQPSFTVDGNDNTTPPGPVNTTWRW